MRALTCALMLTTAPACDVWETECLREPARCAPRSIAVTPSSAIDRAVSDNLSLQIDGPLRETAPRRVQLEDGQGTMLVDLGKSTQAPYQFPLSATQRRCLPDQVALRVYQLAESVPFSSLSKEEQVNVTLDVPTISFASALIPAVAVAPTSAEQSGALGGMWIINNPRTEISQLQLLWQFTDGGTAGPRNRFRAYEYNPGTRLLEERTTTSTPAPLDGGAAWGAGQGTKGLVVQQAAAGSLIAFGTDSAIDPSHVLQTSWARFNNNPTGLTYQTAPAPEPVAVAVDAQRSVALIAGVDGSAQPFVAARLPPFDNSAPPALPVPFPTVSARSLTSLESVTGVDSQIRFLIVDGAGALSALRYDPATKSFAADGALAQAVQAALASSGVTAIQALAAADLNNDGLPDLAIAARDGAASLRLHLYRNQSTSGQLAFQPAAPIAAIDLAPAALSSVAQLALGDLDGDSRVDVALASPATGGAAPRVGLLLQTCPFLQ